MHLYRTEATGLINSSEARNLVVFGTVELFFADVLLALVAFGLDCFLEPHVEEDGELGPKNSWNMGLDPRGRSRVSPTCEFEDEDLLPEELFGSRRVSPRKRPMDDARDLRVLCGDEGRPRSTQDAC